jgi:multidrug efflux pump subunit AcrB
MWIVSLALRRPYTFVVLAIVIVFIGTLAILRTPTDIFPNINIPVVSVVWNFTGMSPRDMSERIVWPSERAMTTTVNDIEHIESQSYDGVGVVKVFFHPNVQISTAIAQVTAIAQTIVRSLPPGTQPPLIIQYNASTVPVLQIGLSSRTLPEQRLNDIGMNFLRTQLATVQGASIPYPYGGKMPEVAVNLDPARLQAKDLTPVDVVDALTAQNLILPQGTAKIGPLEYQVGLNGSPELLQQLNDVPIRTENGAMVYVRDVAQVSNGFSPQTNIVRQNGVRGVLVTIMKTGEASTLDIVHRVLSELPRAAQTLPRSLTMKPLFDQSIFVRAAIKGVLREALIAALLTAAMILLFLGSWRSMLVVTTSIPLSILTSLIILSALGETINIMTLGGLALAVGILVDDATVTIENIERHLAEGKPLKDAILDGAQQIAVPALVSTLSICIVFVPMFFLSGVARFLFIPMAEAVVFAMLASYFLSRTLVPTMVMYLLRSHQHEEAPGLPARFQHGFERWFERRRQGYRNALETCLHHRRVFSWIFAGFCAASLGLIFILGADFFPQVDAGQMDLHVRARTGLRVEETASLCDQIESFIRAKLPRGEIGGVIDNVGLPYSGLNLSYSPEGTIGSSDAQILIALAPNHAPTADLERRLRPELLRAFPGTQFFFLPADIVSQILNFGLPAPIDIQLVGNDTVSDYRIAQRISRDISHVPGAVDVRVQQRFDDPTLDFSVDRSRAEMVGLSERDVAQDMLVSLSSSFQTSPSFWLNPSTGVSYNVAVQVPQYRIHSLQNIANIPIAGGQVRAGTAPQILANLASMNLTSGPVVASHYDARPVVDVYAAAQDRDLGGVAGDVEAIVERYSRQLPRGTFVSIRGQVETMRQSFIGLGFGLLAAIVLVYLLIVVNFQSWLDPFIIIMALPGAIAGILWILLVTHTTINVPSLTGAVMSVGVATANSILLVSFARERLDSGVEASRAALEAGFVRLRPVIMTALAMIIGMMPMALGMGEGGEQNAPLGRAVIGGLLFATIGTLFFVPVVFSAIHGRRGSPHAGENR